MGEEKPKGVFKGKARRFALGGEVIAALSFLFLVPFVRRRREHRRGRWHDRIAILWH